MSDREPGGGIETEQGSNSALNLLLSGKISSIDKYRSTPMANNDYDRARVVLTLKSPEDLRLYYALKSAADNDKIQEIADMFRSDESDTKITQADCDKLRAASGSNSAAMPGYAPTGVIKNYRKKGLQPMRPYIPGEDLTGVSVSEEDTPELGGMIAIGTDNEARWYVSKRFFEDNYVEA